jgi:hypothetical protein
MVMSNNLDKNQPTMWNQTMIGSLLWGQTSDQNRQCTFRELKLVRERTIYIQEIAICILEKCNLHSGKVQSAFRESEILLPGKPKFISGKALGLGTKLLGTQKNKKMKNNIQEINRVFVYSRAQQLGAGQWAWPGRERSTSSRSDVRCR